MAKRDRRVWGIVIGEPKNMENMKAHSPHHIKLIGEWFCHSDGVPIEFRTRQRARNYLKENGNPMWYYHIQRRP